MQVSQDEIKSFFKVLYRLRKEGGIKTLAQPITFRIVFKTTFEYFKIFCRF